MFDIMKYAEKNHVEIDVRPGVKPVVWEFFIRDRALGAVEFRQVFDRELVRQYNVDAYLETRCDEMMQEIEEARRLAKKAG